MGACATKPKVLKEEGKAPEPAKEKEVAVEDAGGGGGGGDEAVVAVVEEEKIVLEREIGDKVKEIVDDDDQGSNKRRSLSNLFKENGGKASAESDEKGMVEPVKKESVDAEKSMEPVMEEASLPEQPMELVKEVPVVTKKLVKVPEAKQPELEKPEKPVDEPEAKQPELEKPLEEPEAKQPELVKPEIHIERTPTSAVVEEPVKVEVEKADEATTAAETKINETTDEKNPDETK